MVLETEELLFDIDSIQAIVILEDTPNRFEIMVGTQGNVMKMEDDSARAVVHAYKQKTRTYRYTYEDGI